MLKCSYSTFVNNRLSGYLRGILKNLKYFKCHLVPKKEIIYNIFNAQPVTQATKLGIFFITHFWYLKLRFDECRHP